jgi:hypothetical protein
VTGPTEVIRIAVDRRRAEDRSTQLLFFALFGLGAGSLIAGVVAGFLGNEVLSGLLLGGTAVANGLLFFPVRELRRKRNLSPVLETFPALLALGPGNPQLQAKLVDLLGKLITLVEHGE